MNKTIAAAELAALVPDLAREGIVNREATILAVLERLDPRPPTKDEADQSYFIIGFGSAVMLFLLFLVWAFIFWVLG